MTKLTKNCLNISATGLVAGSAIDFGGLDFINPLSFIVLPLGAVFFGAALISFMLENEMAKFDAEQTKKTETVEPNKLGEKKCNGCITCRCQPSTKLIPAMAR